MSSLPVKCCPGCGIVLPESKPVTAPEPEGEEADALDPQAPPRVRIRQQAKLAEGLRQVVERYTAHNNELERVLRKSPVGGRLFRGAHRFKDD